MIQKATYDQAHTALSTVFREEAGKLAGNLAGYHLFHAIRGELLVELGRCEQAKAAGLRALLLTGNSAERSLLQHRLDCLETSRE